MNAQVVFAVFFEHVYVCVHVFAFAYMNSYTSCVNRGPQGPEEEVSFPGIGMTGG